MDAENHPVWQRIAAFSLDRADATLTYTARLARENGWSRVYARRVVEEYKRFMFLAVVAEHVVSPSEAVDHAWHLHLVYTRSYWGEFCGRVLGKKIHHDPTTGVAEQAKFVDLYERTRETYADWFGLAPPVDIWPDAHVRFGEDIAARWVNTARNWVVPKPSCLRRIGLPPRAAVLASVAVVPSLVIAANPFDFAGVDFLKFYGVLFGFALIAAFIARRVLADDPTPADRDAVSPTEAAFLAGGMERALHAAISHMLHAGQLKLTETPTKLLGVISTGVDRRLVADAPLASDVDPLERVTYEAASVKDGATAADLSQVAAKVCPTIRGRLADRGLVGRHPLVDPSRIVPALVLWIVAAIGAIKIAVGLARDKPVGFLVLAALATIAISLLFLSRRRVTPRGERLVAQLREQHRPLAAIDPTNPTGIAANDVAMAVALFGVMTLAAGQWEAHARAIQSFHYAHGNTGGGCGATGTGCGAGGCSSGCGGGGCGGGGCGGGGCGGGGCGGCSA